MQFAEFKSDTGGSRYRCLFLGAQIRGRIFQRALHLLYTDYGRIVPDVVDFFIAAHIAVEQRDAFESFQDLFAHIVSADDEGHLGQVPVFCDR